MRAPRIVLAAFIVLATLASASRATAQQAAPDPNDEVLRRVLRSGCRDGVSDVQRLAAAGGTTWAATVGRLCGEILAAPAPAATPAVTAKPRARGERSGRGAMVISSTLYGLWLGVATDVLFELDNVRAAVAAPLVGLGAGLGLSLLVTRDHPIDNAQAWTIITGLEFGSVDGLLWAGSFDLSAKTVVGATLATGLTSGAVGLLVAKSFHPNQGDVEVIRSGLIWGTAAGVLGILTLSSDPSSNTLLRGAGTAMDLGFLGGLALAASFDVSRERDLIIDAGALGGGVVGFGATALVLGSSLSGHGRLIAGTTLGGMAAGIVTAAILTRHWDEGSSDDEDGAPVAALVGRDARGRWSVGAPGPSIVLDGTGTRPIGATFAVLGGAL
jgi:hypothetical protein